MPVPALSEFLALVSVKYKFFPSVGSETSAVVSAIVEITPLVALSTPEYEPTFKPANVGDAVVAIFCTVSIAPSVNFIFIVL